MSTKLNVAEVRKKLSVAYAEMEKANEKSLLKAAHILKELEGSLSMDTSPVIPANLVSGTRRILGVGRISDAQELVASAIRIIDAAGNKAE